MPLLGYVILVFSLFFGIYLKLIFVDINRSWTIVGIRTVFCEIEMVKSQDLVKFEKLAALLLEFETDFLGASQLNQTASGVDLQKEELKILWEKVRFAYEAFTTSNVIEDSDEDCGNAKDLYKECRLAYITVAAQMGELSQSFINKSVLSSTQCFKHCS